MTNIELTHEDKAFRGERQALASALSAALPEKSILSDEEELKPYECDGLSAYRATPFVVVLPETIEEVQHVLRICQRLDTPIVVRGAGTGLSGGALPHQRGVLLSLAKFNRIIDIDPHNRCARVEPGVRNLAISGAADKIGRAHV